MEKIKNLLKERERENEMVSKQLRTLRDLYGRWLTDWREVCNNRSFSTKTTLFGFYQDFYCMNSFQGQINICVFLQTRTGKTRPSEEGESPTCHHRSGGGSSDCWDWARDRGAEEKELRAGGSHLHNKVNISLSATGSVQYGQSLLGSVQMLRCFCVITYSLKLFHPKTTTGFAQRWCHRGFDHKKPPPGGEAPRAGEPQRTFI